MKTKKTYINADVTHCMMCNKPEILVEEWKVYKETYNSRWGHRVYEVSNFGRVKVNGVITEPYMATNGYYIISGFCVHRAVAELFIPNPENKPCVDHIDTNIHNNMVTNLRWVTHKENMNNSLTRKHLSEIQSNPEYRQKQSEARKGEKNGFFGKHHIGETKQKISKKLTGENNYMYGKPSHIRGKHRVYNNPNDHTAGYHYE